MRTPAKDIKPGRDFPFAEAVLVDTVESIKANQLLVVTGVTGGGSTGTAGTLEVAVADASSAEKSMGRLLIAKHDCPAGGRGIAVPWRLVYADTSEWPPGTKAYLGEKGQASSKPGAFPREVGTILPGNRVLLTPEAYGAAVGPLTLSWKVGKVGRGAGKAVTSACQITDIRAIPLNNNPAGTLAISVTAPGKDAEKVTSLSFVGEGVSKSDVVRATRLENTIIPAGSVLSIRGGGKGNSRESLVYIDLVVG